MANFSNYSLQEIADAGYDVGDALQSEEFWAAEAEAAQAEWDEANPEAPEASRCAADWASLLLAGVA